VYEQRRRPRKENQVFNENLPLITAVGATSKQGRSTAHTLLASGRYRVRALTRNVDSPEARSLAAQGAELVAVPVEVGHTRELTRAFRGSHGVFLMTPMIIPPATHEFDLGKQLADAAVEAGVQYVIYSALENVDKITGGKKWVPHFTDKARRVTGRKAAYRSACARDELLRYFPAFGANEMFLRELLEMAEYAVEYGYFRPHRDLEWSRKIDRATLTWEGFLRKTNWQGEAMSFRMAQ
jgi:hypothetical protein